jgi:hypothetical protein
MSATPHAQVHVCQRAVLHDLNALNVVGLTEAKRLTAGVIIGQGIHPLNNASVLGAINLRARVISDKLCKSKQKTHHEMRTRIKRVREI